MAVALPELPDDRRARPQRVSPAGPAASPYAVRTPPEGHRVSRVDDPTGAPVHGAGDRAGERRPGTNGSARSRPAPGSADQDGAVANGARRAGSGPDAVRSPGSRANLPAQGVRNGAVRNGPGTGQYRPVAGPALTRRGPAPDDEPTEVHGELVDDEPTEIHGGLVEDGPADPDTSSEVPGRHRRRAGASPTARPAAEYKAQADAARTGRKPRSGRRRRENFWRELPVLIVVALVLTFCIQTFLAKVYVIPSGSMETTLHGCTGCTNDRVLVDKVSKHFVDPQPGDVVVFRGPDGWTNTEFSVPETDNPLINGLQQFGSLIGLAPPDEKDFVKRVIAVGGQTVQCCDSRDRVLVDGEPLDEPYIYYIPEGRDRQDPFDPVTVPEGQLWMMGDSRNNSADSRAPGHGPVPVENVIGQARLIVLPFARFGWISSVDPQPADAVGLGPGAGVPLALGMLGTLPVALWRRRRGDATDRFLP